MAFLLKHNVEAMLFLIVLLLHFAAAMRLRNHPRVLAYRHGRWAVAALTALLLGTVTFGFILDAVRVHRLFPVWVFVVFRPLSLFWAMIVL